MCHYFIICYSSPELSFKRAKDGLTEYQRWNKSGGRQKVSRLKAKWCRPCKGFVKINFDASINQQRECFGMGVVARHDSGCVLLTASKTQLIVATVEMAEIYAADWAVTLAKDQQWSKVEFEGDAVLVIENYWWVC